MICIFIIIEVTGETGPASDNPLEKKKRTSRGYYGGVGYPYVPFAEPLTILAGLAFIAYIIQMFHALYHTHNGGLLGGGAGGGLLNNVLPPKSTKMFSKVNEENAGRVFY
ncbi:hypothetical protein RUM44_000474 [Polyplax serrata]|uniref:Uncharacterized protein n=1 Tax=Polyplax serrata TaxID=468196 RepID=A0ABR1B5J2_POLSC